MDAQETAFILVLAGIALLFLAAVVMVFVELSLWSRQGTRMGVRLRVVAAERAEALLRDVLDEREYQQLTRRGYLDVTSPTDAQRIYRIPAHVGLVRMYEHGVAVRELCVQPVEPLPSADVIAMHKLMIQGNEQEYLARARQFTPMRTNQRYRP
ncbi:MAG TPA: hypothetical protein VKT52_11415 [Ktedonobacterales bacterium]|nr:hypothetical protein [Ktedonobacterales bacterium]